MQGERRCRLTNKLQGLDRASGTGQTETLVCQTCLASRFADRTLRCLEYRANSWN